MKKVYLTFLLALVLISSVSALSIKQNSIHDTIIPQFNQPAEIQLIITGAEAGSYNLYTLTDVKITPTSNFNLHTGTNTVTTYIYPTDSLDARGIYSFSYALKKLDGQTYEDAMTVKVKDIQDAIEISSDSNNPDDGKLTFYIKNKENTDIQDLKVKLSSIFFEFEERFDLPPYEKKFFTVDVDKNLLKTSEAGSYLVKAEIKTDKGDQELIGKLFIGEKKGIDTTEDKSGILTRTTTITKINTGNVVESITVRVERGFFTKFFTTFSPAPTLVDKQGLTSIYLWNLDLAPTQHATIKAKTNYWIPFLVIVFLVLLFYGLKKYRENKLEITKSVSKVKTKGGQFALRVKITIKTRRAIQNVSLTDSIPAFVKLYNKFETIRPDKIDAKNRRLQWNLGDLGAGEERAFSYVVYSKDVDLVGTFSLPSATALFESNSEVHETFSNHVFFEHDQRK